MKANKTPNPTNPLTALDRMNPCALGRTYIDGVNFDDPEMIQAAWERNRHPEFVFWYLLKAVRRRDVPESALRQFCRVALAPYAVMGGVSSQEAATAINRVRPASTEDQWASVAVFAYARACESAERKHAIVAACGVSNWLCACVASMAMEAGCGESGAAKLIEDERERQAELLRCLMPNPLLRPKRRSIALGEAVF